MKRKRDKRWRFWADNKIQGGLVARILVYWIVCQLAMVVTMVGMSFLLEGSSASGVGSLSSLLVPGLTASALVLPFALLDTIVFSNRFTGPMMRLRKHLEEMAETGSAGDIRLRANDFHTQAATDLMEVRRKLPPSDPDDANRVDESVCLPMLQTNCPMGSKNHV